jgi:hypothetical protein
MILLRARRGRVSLGVSLLAVAGGLTWLTVREEAPQQPN